MSYAATALLLVQAENAAAQDRPIIKTNPLPEEVAANIVNHLALQDESCDIRERRIRTITDAADEKITEALRALGYYRANWEKEIIHTDNCWGLKLDVELGTPVRIGEIDIEITGEAKEDKFFLQRLDNSPLRVGTRINHGQYEAFKRSLQQLALERGYAEGRFTKSQLLVDLDADNGAVKLHFDSGPRYNFGEVRFEQTTFDPNFLTRFRPFSPGQPFDAKLLGQFQQSLVDSRYFAEVGVLQLEPDPDRREIPVRVESTPVAKYSIPLGLGMATDTGPRASAAFKNNRVNRIGHRYAANLGLSEVNSAFDFDYQIPLSKPLSEQIKLKGGWEDVNTDTTESETWSIGASHTTVTGNDWLKSLDLAYQVERFSIAGSGDTTRLLIPGIGWFRSQADNPAYPTSGWRMQGSLRGATDQLGSDISFLQLRGSAKYILGVGRGRLLGRIDAGTSLVNQFAEFPGSLRFFAGGDNSVRGFDYQELGPTDEDGRVIGGKHLLTASLEYDHRIFDNYGLALFYDIGNAFDNQQFTLKRSVGFGARWHSPIGPIRLDFAFPLGEDRSFRLHLSMGPDL